jgi:methyl-accepting chemotaxis protein/methyl-accepting chemotaxis protein-1 (serine sensor receptor)
VDTQLSACVIAMVASTAVMAFMSLRLASDLSSTIQATGSRQLLAGRISAGASEVAEAGRGIAFAAALQDDDEIRKLRRQLSEANQVVGEAVRALKKESIDSTARQKLAELEKAHAPVAKLSENILQQISDQKVEQAMNDFNGKLLPALQNLSKRSRDMVEYESKQFDLAVLAAGTKNEQGRTLTLVALALSLAIAVVVFLVVRSISERLRRTGRRLNESAREVARSAQNMREASESLSRGANEQVASLQEAAASTDELSSLTRLNAEKSHSVTDLMEETQRAVSAGNNSLGQMVEAMNGIGSSSERVSQIIKVIDEIAFKTNTLALNAAVEAARAGEAGAGFVVVADEVGNLAERSAQAARETAELVDESAERASAGKATLSQVSEAIEAITRYAQRVKAMADEVSVSSQEQTRGIDQIVRTVRSVEAITARGVSSAASTAEASQNMGQQATTMMEAVEEMLSMVGGEASSGSARGVRR